MNVVFNYRDFDATPFRHRIANQVMTGFFNLLFGTDYRDLTNGFTAFPEKFIKIACDDLDAIGEAEGYNIEMHLKYLVWKYKFPYVQKMGVCTYYEKSSIVRGVLMTSCIMLGTLRLRLLG
jgi:hypothetical protein